MLNGSMQCPFLVRTRLKQCIMYSRAVLFYPTKQNRSREIRRFKKNFAEIKFHDGSSPFTASHDKPWNDARCNDLCSANALHHNRLAEEGARSRRTSMAPCHFAVYRELSIVTDDFLHYNRGYRLNLECRWYHYDRRRRDAARAGVSRNQADIEKLRQERFLATAAATNFGVIAAGC